MSSEAHEVSELVRQLESKHLAEKHVLQNDIKCYQQITRKLIVKYRALQKEKSKQNISLVLYKKLQE